MIFTIFMSIDTVSPTLLFFLSTRKPLSVLRLLYLLLLPSNHVEFLDILPIPLDSRRSDIRTGVECRKLLQ